MTTLAQSDAPTVRSIIFRIEHDIVNILGWLPSIHLCQVAIESFRQVAGVVRIIDHCEVVCDLLQREIVKNDNESKIGLRSLVVLPAAEGVSVNCSCLTAFRSSDESACYTGAAIHD